MKNEKLFSYLLLFVSLSFLSSCYPENLNYPATAREMICPGKWSVDYYFAGQDKTSEFKTYRFSFLGNGTVIAADSIHSVTATWGMARDVNYNEVLWINTLEPCFQDFNNQWIVTPDEKGRLVMKGAGTEARLKKL